MKSELTNLCKSMSKPFQTERAKRWQNRWPLFYGIILFILIVVVIIQQITINTLQWRIDYMNDYEQKDSYAHRVFHLEVIQKALNSDVYRLKQQVEKLTDDNLYLKMEINELQWKLMKRGWKESP